MSDTPEIKAVHTPCVKCVFATHGKDPDDGLDAQVGCSLGRIDKFRERNEDSVVGAYDEDLNRFFIINGRHCNAKKEENSNWAKDKDPRTYALEIVKDIQVRVSVMVLCNQFFTVEDVRRTIKSLKNQRVQPYEVFFVDAGHQLKPGQMNATIMTEMSNDITWRIVTKTDKALRERVSLRMVDLAFDQVKGNYYTVLTAGEELRADFIDNLNHQLNVELQQIIMVEGNHRTFQTAMHKQMSGNQSLTLVDQEDETKRLTLDTLSMKLWHYATENDSEHLIWREEELCPSH